MQWITSQTDFKDDYISSNYCSLSYICPTPANLEHTNSKIKRLSHVWALAVLDILNLSEKVKIEEAEIRGREYSLFHSFFSMLGQYLGRKNNFSKLTNGSHSHCILCKPVYLVVPDMFTIYPGLKCPIQLDLSPPTCRSAENETREPTLGCLYYSWITLTQPKLHC